MAWKNYKNVLDREKKARRLAEYGAKIFDFPGGGLPRDEIRANRLDAAKRRMRRGMNAWWMWSIKEYRTGFNRKRRRANKRMEIWALKEEEKYFDQITTKQYDVGIKRHVW